MDPDVDPGQRTNSIDFVGFFQAISRLVHQKLSLNLQEIMLLSNEVWPHDVVVESLFLQ